MKVTKSQLKEIIREELQTILEAQAPPPLPAPEYRPPPPLPAHKLAKTPEKLAQTVQNQIADLQARVLDLEKHVTSAAE